MTSFKKIFLASGVAMICTISTLPAYAGDPIFDAYDAYERGEYKKAHTGFLPIAEAGNNDVQFLVGFMHFKGEGIAQSYEHAASWFTKSANGGNVTAMLSLGEMYESNQLGPNVVEAKRWYKMAADAGNKLGQTKYDALFTKPEIPEGFSIYKNKTAPAITTTPSKTEQDTLTIAGRTKADGFYDRQPYWLSSKAIADYKTVPADEMVKDGITANNEKNYEKAHFLFQTAALQGNAEAQFQISELYRQGNGVSKSYEKSVKWLLKSAEQGNPKGQTILGYMYFGGRGITQSYTKSRYWAEQAAAQDNALGTANLAEFYEKGLGGVAKDMDKALRLLNKSAATGLLYAHNELKRLGHPYVSAEEKRRIAAKKLNASLQLYYDAGLVIKNDAEAISSFRYAADRGHAPSQAEMGAAYMLGVGVEVNFYTSKNWLEKAVAQNNAYGMHLLGNIYYNGLSVTKDEQKALIWYRKAADKGHKQGMEAVKTIETSILQADAARAAKKRRESGSWKDQKRGSNLPPPKPVKQTYCMPIGDGKLRCSTY